jgi:hypothetical protein
MRSFRRVLLESKVLVYHNQLMAAVELGHHLLGII